MGVVPADDHLGPSGLLQHVEHLGLEDGVDGFNADAGSGLRHGEHVDHAHRVVVHELSQHQTHHLGREMRSVRGLNRHHDESLELVHGIGASYAITNVHYIQQHRLDDPLSDL